MTIADDIDGLDGIALAALVRRREVTARELWDAVQERAERVGDLNAVVEPLDEVAERCLSRAGSCSPLAGVPTYLKALMSAVQGAPLTAASACTRGLVAPGDSYVTARLVDAGLVIGGFTNSPELGLCTTTEPAFYGATGNPWSGALSPGGSSGGAAAAVAAGIVPVAHATDGGGSIRIPAACCGLVGLKPSRGRVSFGPGVGEGWGGLACIGSVSRTVRDTAAWLDVIAGAEPGDPYTAPPAPDGGFAGAVSVDPGRLRIGLCVEAFNRETVDPACADAAIRAARICEGLGHRIEETGPEHDADALWTSNVAVIAANVEAALGAIGRLRGRPVGPGEVEAHTEDWRERARGLEASEYVRHLTALHAIGRQVARWLGRFDAVLTPTLAVPEIRLGHLDTTALDFEELTRRIRPTIGFTSLFNVSGSPAISLPVVSRSDDLPIGIQIAAGYGQEAKLLGLAGALEAAAPWHDRRPTRWAAATPGRSPA